MTFRSYCSRVDLSVWPALLSVESLVSPASVHLCASDLRFLADSTSDVGEKQSFKLHSHGVTCGD